MASATSAQPVANATEKTDAAAVPQGSPAVALTGGAPKAGTPPYASGSLYVGDLSADVTEAILFDTFNAVGPVASVRVCRDAATRRSLGYAYVNFINLLDAERALDTMNFSNIKGRACRIMWSHRDPSLRKSGLGNIFVKNLAKTIDNKALFDTFSVCGNILSCKVAVNAKRESLGYGFVQFSEPEAAQQAIEQINGMIISGEKVAVQAFKSKKERSGGVDSKKQYTNVYVKNLPLAFTKAKLDETFSKYGTITSSTLAMYTNEEWKEKLEKDEARAKLLAAKKEKEAKEKEAEEKAKAAAGEGKAGDAKAEGKEAKEPKADAGKDDTTGTSKSSKSASSEDKDSKLPAEKCKGFGFVNFSTPQQAQAAVDGLNGTEFHGKKLFVSRAQKKEERDRELRDKFELYKLERQKKYAGVNLYVKNLADSVDEKKLHAEFAKFGSITSHKIMLDEKKKSRGFGFVCFSSPDEATKAVTEMNGRMVDGKPLYVALAQRKEVRRAQLEQQYSQRSRGPNMGGYQQPFGMYPPQQRQPGPFFQGQPNGGMMPRRPFQGPPQQFQQPPMYGMPMNPNQAMMMGGRGMPMNPNQPTMQYQLVPQGGRGVGGPMGGRGGPMGPGRGGRGGARGRGGMNPRGGAAGMSGGRGRGGPTQPLVQGGGQGMPLQAQPAVKYAQGVKNVPAPAEQQMPEAALSTQQEPLTSSQLAAAPEETRKQLLGERLFPLIATSQPKLAGKITGMLLEMDNGELLHLLESQPALAEKIQEAIAVLQESEREEQAAAAGAPAAANGTAADA